MHLDWVTDLTATTFVRCQRKFAARRGTPSVITSDNAKTFKASAKLVKRLCNSNEVKEHLETNRIDWKFNLERLPGGADFMSDSQALPSVVSECRARQCEAQR